MALLLWLFFFGILNVGNLKSRNFRKQLQNKLLLHVLVGAEINHSV